MREARFEAQAIRELGLREAEDSAIWDYALSHDAVIVTKDQDFADRLLSVETAPIIVWLRIGNTSNRTLLAWLLPIWPEIVSRIESGDKLIEVRERLSP